MKTNIIGIILLLLVVYSCKEDAVVETTGYPFITLSEVTDITSEGATFNAKIINLGSQKILDYGFVWVDNVTKPTLNNTFKSLGNNPSLGDFHYRAYVDLQKGKRFNVRAYIKTDEHIVYSNIQSFISEGCKPVVISEYYPDSGSAGSIVTLIGKNFSSKTSNNKIYFGTLAATIIKSNFDTIWVQCPTTSATLSVNIAVEVAGQRTIASKKFTLINPWNLLQNFPGGSRFHSSYFTIGTKGYVCMGMYEFQKFSPKVLWVYDTATNSWIQKKEFPGPNRIESIGFSILNKGYIGLGTNYTNEVTFLRDLYEYDPGKDTWSKKADFPGTRGYGKPLYYIINQKLYIYTGRLGNELWKYDPLKDVWELLPKLNIINTDLIKGSFTFDNKGFLFDYQSDSIAAILEYDSIQNRFDKILDIPKPSNSFSVGGDCFVLKDYVYAPLHDGKIIQYDFRSNIHYIIVAPSANFRMNFIFPFKDKVIINKSESDQVYEFCPR